MPRNTPKTQTPPAPPADAAENTPAAMLTDVDTLTLSVQRYRAAGLDKSIRAARVAVPFSVTVPNDQAPSGRIIGKAGDWLMVDANGCRYVVSDANMKKSCTAV